MSFCEYFADFDNSKIIVVIANYRTGGTELCRRMSDALNMPAFLKPSTTTTFPPFREGFLRELANGGKFIVKIIPDQMDDDMLAPLWGTDFRLIGVRRRDIMSQLMSMYIAKMTDKWSQGKVHEYYGTIPINREVMSDAVDRILNNERKLLAMRTTFEKMFFYEDIDFSSFANLTQFKTSKPDNFDELRDELLDYY